MNSEATMTTRRARISNMSRIRQQKIAPALPVAETQRLFQQPTKNSLTWFRIIGSR